MSSFNWFRRGYDEAAPPNAEANPADSQSQAQSQKTSESSSGSSPSGSSQMNSEDYLKWAKAAYQNIQKQSAASAAESSTPSTEPTAAPVDPQGAEGAEVAPEISAVEQAVPTPMVSDPAASDQPESDITAEPRAGEATEPALAAAPFWARAEAERQERLERLKETAIAEPEPEPQTSAATSASPDLPGVDFDEAFVWSAEVLAAQGRRPDDISLEEITWLKRLRQGLDKTRRSLINQLKAIVGQGPLNEAAVMEIEALLLQADVGVAATDDIIETLQAKLRQETLPPEQAIAYLKSILRQMLDSPLEGTHNLTFVPEKETLSIWLLTGVNGAGKTTTIGKIAHIAKKSGYECLIAAADTFRAAAVEQVKVWGQRSNVEVIANPGQNTDPAAVVFDAITAAKSRNIELLLIDTAGRLQNKKNLMDELSKVRRIISKKAPDAKVESLLVLDATLGQNGLRQAEVFSEAAQLSGVVLTKLDGTAKGGVALAVVKQLGLPIRFIGAGEGIEDLRPFSSYEFVEALLSS
ncbi:MAG: signal recognition particle-docking protein FtsY [Leptolyngbyaceae cyanobacterium SL_1_1]|nr:signal recognition particle-docking protein FtsY [Leptolyngbyaceae cyanobacterium RM1_1_2]NJO09741.1 signal recognition particle-docking protein FtsY [Leptolyngbyaceae cyanobacterium SL_1_1]